jgi:hypothetical protein
MPGSRASTTSNSTSIDQHSCRSMPLANIIDPFTVRRPHVGTEPTASSGKPCGLQSGGEVMYNVFRGFLQSVQVNARYYIQLCRKYVLHYALKLSSSSYSAVHARTHTDVHAYIPLKTNVRLLFKSPVRTAM